MAWKVLEESPSKDYMISQDERDNLIQEQKQENVTPGNQHIGPLQAGLDALTRAPGNFYEAGKSLVGGALDIPSTSFRDVLKSGARGGIGFAQNALNVPYNMVEYLRNELATRKQNRRQEEQRNPKYAEINKYLGEDSESMAELPAWLNAWKPSNETMQGLEDYKNRFKLDNPENKTNQLVEGLAEFLPNLAFTAGNPYVATMLHSTGKNKNIFEDLLPLFIAKNPKETIDIGKSGFNKGIQVARKATDVAINDIAPAINKGVNKGIQVAKKGAEAVKENVPKIIPKSIRDAKRLEKEIIELNEQKLGADKEVFNKIETTGDKLSKNLERLQNKAETNSQSLANYAPKQEALARINAREQFKEQSKALIKELNKDYYDYYMSPIGTKGTVLGQKPVRYSATIDNARAGFYKDAIKVLEKNGVKSHTNILGIKEGKKPTIKQIIDLRRDVTQQRLIEGEQSKNNTISPAKKGKARLNKNYLEELEQDLWKDIEQNLTPKQFAKLKEIDKKYGDLVKPFHSDTFLSEATDPYGNVKGEHLFENINKIGADELVKRLGEVPEFKEAITKHDLMNFDFNKLSDIEKLLNGDFSRFIPDSIKRDLEKQRDILKEINLTRTMQKTIKQNELTLILNEPEMQRVLAKYPDMINMLADVKNARINQAELARRLKEADVEKMKADAMAKKWYDAAKAAGFLGGFSYLVKFITSFL